MKSSVKGVWTFWKSEIDRRFWTVSGVEFDPEGRGFDLFSWTRAVVDDFGNLVAVQ